MDNLALSRGTIVVPKTGRQVPQGRSNTRAALAATSAELAYEEVTEAPKCRLKLKKDASHAYRTHERLVGNCSEYSSCDRLRPGAPPSSRRKLIRRRGGGDGRGPAAARGRFSTGAYIPAQGYLTPKRLPAVVRPSPPKAGTSAKASFSETRAFSTPTSVPASTVRAYGRLNSAKPKEAPACWTRRNAGDRSCSTMARSASCRRRG